jgi:hypothetical protein
MQGRSLFTTVLRLLDSSAPTNLQVRTDATNAATAASRLAAANPSANEESAID